MERPKRRKSKDNPYTLKIINNTYIVTFIDGNNVKREISLSKEVFNEMDKFELEDISQMHKVDRHIERKEFSEININKKALVKPALLEDDFINNTSFKELRDAIDKLPNIQKRRIKKYYFDEKNEYEIAMEENTSQQAINKSLKHAIKNLKKFLKKF